MRSDWFIKISSAFLGKPFIAQNEEKQPQFVIKSLGGLLSSPVHIGASRHCQRPPPQLCHVITFLLCFNRFCVNANLWTRQSYVAKNETKTFQPPKRFPCLCPTFSAKSGFNPARVINTAPKLCWKSCLHGSVKNFAFHKVGSLSGKQINSKRAEGFSFYLNDRANFTANVIVGKVAPSERPFRYLICCVCPTAHTFPLS